MYPLKFEASATNNTVEDIFLTEASRHAFPRPPRSVEPPRLSFFVFFAKL